MNRRLKAVIIFDVDGTLLQTDRITVPAVQRTFAAFRLPIPAAEDICGFFGKPIEDYEAWLAAQCPPECAAALIEATNHCELSLIGSEGNLYPGIRETLDALHSTGYVLALCSNGPETYVEEFLDAHAVRRYFSAVCTRGMRCVNKTAMVREILRQFPARPVIVVGDRRDDIDAAHENNGRAIAAAYGFGSAEEWHGADAVAASSLEVISCIQALLARIPEADRR